MAMTAKQGRVVAVCRSDRKGTSKVPVESGHFLEDYGLEGDAHGGAPVRQVSLLCLSSLEKMRAKAPDLGPGDFAENLTIDGCESSDLSVGTRLHFERGPILEITQVGKACHKGCAIRDLIGDCIMPREGLFARVLRGGEIRPGDIFEVRGDESEGCPAGGK